MYRSRIFRDATPVWRDSGHICALSDGDRHLGHIVLTAEWWIAFDATHPSESGDGFRYLGIFPSVALAKTAVDACVAREALDPAWLS